MPARAASATSVVEVVERRLRPLAARRSVAVAQHAEDLAQVVERLVRVGLDQRGGLAHLLARSGRCGSPAPRRAWRPARSGGRARRASRGRSGPARSAAPARPGAPARPRRARPAPAAWTAGRGARRCTCRSASMAIADEHAEDEVDPQPGPVDAGLDHGRSRRRRSQRRRPRTICAATPPGGQRDHGERAGPLAVTETAPMTLVSSATASGQRRRKQISTQADEAERQVEPEPATAPSFPLPSATDADHSTRLNGDHGSVAPQ